MIAYQGIYDPRAFGGSMMSGVPWIIWTANHTKRYAQPLDHAGSPTHDLFKYLAGCVVWEEQSIPDILVKKQGEIKLKFSADEMQS